MIIYWRRVGQPYPLASTVLTFRGQALPLTPVCAYYIEGSLEDIQLAGALEAIAFGGAVEVITAMGAVEKIALGGSVESISIEANRGCS